MAPLPPLVVAFLSALGGSLASLDDGLDNFLGSSLACGFPFSYSLLLVTDGHF